MTSIIRIKRSEVAGNPGTLAAGEFAYSALPASGSNGGDRLYIGIGSETGGNAANHYVVGGKYFTDMLSHTKGTLTASSALIVDSNSKIDVINVGNLTVTGSSNTVSSTNTNGNIVLTPNGTGYVTISGTNGLVIPSGTTGQQGPSVTGTIRYNTSTTQFEGYSGSNWSSLGGVRSVDGQTYIIAEATPGAGDDTLYFYANNIEVATLTTSGFSILDHTAATSNTTGALKVAGGASVEGNLYVGGNLVLTGTETVINGVTFDQGLTLSGSTSAGSEYFTINNGDVSPVIKFQVDTSSGNTTIAGTLGVTGLSTLDSLTVTNAALVSGTLSATGDFAVNTNKFKVIASSGNTTVAGTLGVTGATTLSNTLDVASDFAVNTNKFKVIASTGNTTIAGSLGVTGAGTFTSTVDINDTLTVIGSTVSGTQYFIINNGDTIPVNKFTVDSANGNTLISGTLGVTGLTSLSTLSTSGLATLNSASISNSATVGTTLGVTGATNLYSTLNVTGATTLSSTADVTGDFAVNTTKFKVIAASGNTTVAGTLGVTGASTISSLSATSGAFSTTLGVTGDFAVNSTKFTVAATSGNTAVAGTFDVTGNSVLHGTLGVTSATTLSSTLDVASDFKVNTNKFIVTAANGNTTVAGTLSVTGVGEFSSSLSSTGDFAVNTSKFTVASATGNSSVAGTLDVANDFRVNTSKFTVASATGNTSVAGTFAVTSTSTFHNTVSLDNNYITNLKDPQNPQDAATKFYVDNAITGLTWKDSVNVLADIDVPLTGTTPLVIDSHTLSDGYRVLLIGQSTASQDGIYDLAIDSGAGTYALTRSLDADTYSELISVSVFVIEGDVYESTGWTQSNTYLTSFSGQSWVQFSGAGAYTAGDGLGQLGTLFFVNVAANGGIEIVSDSLQLKSSTAGAGLTYTTGVFDVVGTADRITANANSIDIASTYVGQTSITTLGTISTGTWSATTIAVNKGGTGLTTVTSNGILYGNATSALGVTAAATIDGSFLKADSTGNPYFSNVIDGGTY